MINFLKKKKNNVSHSDFTKINCMKANGQIYINSVDLLLMLHADLHSSYELGNKRKYKYAQDYINTLIGSIKTLGGIK